MVKIQYYDKNITKEKHDEEMDRIQVILDKAVNELYGIDELI